MLLPVYGSRSSSSFAMAALKEIVPSNQRLPHWVVDTISHAYGASGRPPAIRAEMPLYKEHLNILGCTESGAPGDHLRAASWASSGTFSSFYRVNVATPHSLGVVRCFQ